MRLPISRSRKALAHTKAMTCFHRLRTRAAGAGLLFVELKAIMFAGILAHVSGDPTEAVTLLEECLPRQLVLGHINLIAQELCPRPELVSRILRRHRSNGLGPALLEAVSRHWSFPETALTLKELGPSQVATWIDHIASHPGSWHAGHGGTRRRQTVARPVPTTDPSPLDQLTVRERDVLELMAQSSYQRGDRGRPLHRRVHREDARQPHPPQARPDQPTRRRPRVPAPERARR